MSNGMFHYIVIFLIVLFVIALAWQKSKSSPDKKQKNAHIATLLIGTILVVCVLQWVFMGMTGKDVPALLSNDTDVEYSIISQIPLSETVAVGIPPF